MSVFVLDSSAVLAVLFAEPGYELVQSVTPGSFICAVNRSELLKKALDRNIDLKTVRGAMERLQMIEVPFDGQLVEATAILGNRLRKSGLSFADCACISLGITFKLPVLTADRMWSRLKTGAEVRQIRGAGAVS